MSHKRTYLYLARRDKKGVQLLASFQNKESQVYPTRVTDVKALKLSPAMERDVEKSVEENKMLWECWIQSADSFQDLKNRLSNMGYKKSQMPNNAQPLFVQKISPVSKEELKKPDTTNTDKPKTMMRKKS